MTNKKTKTLIGVAWPYVNGDLHPGHIVGCYLPADILARFKRLQGNEVMMVSGTDNHGTPITIQADKEGVTPQEIVDKYGPRIHKLLTETYKISFDSFTGTSSDLHKKITQEFFINLANNGKIIKKKTEQYYSAEDNKFLPDRYVEGECSYCNAKEQRGDQCENCGRSLQVGELLNPYAKLTKNPVSLKETEHYFVDLSLFRDDLKKYLSDKKDSWRPWVWNEANAWIEELQPRAITRDIDWGVEIPQDGLPEKLKIEGAANKRFYVWFDAVIGYFSEGIKLELSRRLPLLNQEGERGGVSSNLEIQNEFLQKFWNSNDQDLEHFLFVGKDNLFFHTLWWQSLLTGQGDKFGGINLKLADNVPVNQFLNLEGKKFSKSRNIYIDATKLVDVFGLDAIRFYLSSIMPETSDSNWVWKDFQQTVNSELNGNLGNFVHRTLTFYQNKLGGKFETNPTFDHIHVLSEPSIDPDEKLEVGIERPSDIKIAIQDAFDNISRHLSAAQFLAAQNELMKLGNIANKYFNDREPWKLLKEDRAECETVIYTCIQLVNALRILTAPFLPDASDRLSEILGLEKLNSNPSAKVGEDIFKFTELSTLDFKLSTNLTPLFTKIEDEQIEEFNKE